MAHTVSVSIGALEMKFETGRLAKIADGACVLSYGDTMVFAAAGHGKPRMKLNFLPLTMDYREKMYAGGSIPGGFFKREGRPSEKEILTMRMMDRPMRPLFPAGLQRDIQVQAIVLSSDTENDADVLAINAGSCALALGSLPWNGPVGAVRVGRVDGEYILNPTCSQREESDMDVVVVGTEEAITMVESSANEVVEADMVRALEIGHEAVVEICKVQKELVAVAGKEKISYEPLPEDEGLLASIRSEFKDQLHEAHRKPGRKLERSGYHKEAINAILDKHAPADADGNRDPDRKDLVKRYAETVSQEVFRDICLTGKRYDDRGPEDIRDIECEVGLLPRAHGSALFQRGETQGLVVATLGTKREEQLIEGLHETYYRKFMLHYNFPPFSVGETRPIRGPGRREIGHGKLGERALQAVLPPHEDFPYTIRVVSEILESNGSSSMASVCGGTLALMDAGVKISQPVAGIAMGLVVGDAGKEVIMTDIAGKEDAWGDMDFKVAGTQRGITALQMDIKIAGVSSDLLQRALEQAKRARIEILRHMLRALRRPREELSRYAPRLERIYIPKEKIGAIIGPGGKVIRGLQEEYEVTIDVNDDGAVTIYAVNGERIEQVKEIIENMTREAEVGRVYEGKVVSIKDFGAFVELLPGMEALCHVSELDDGYVDRPEDVVQVGDPIKVKCIYVDPSGKVKVSRKAVVREEKGLPPEEPALPTGGGRRGGGGRRDGGRGGRSGGSGGGGRPRR